jgi:hypothetical protein
VECGQLGPLWFTASESALAWALLALFLPLMGLAAGEPAEPFAGEEQFRQPLTLSVRESPLEDFLAGLARERGLPVSAGQGKLW